MVTPRLAQLLGSKEVGAISLASPTPFYGWYMVLVAVAHIHLHHVLWGEVAWEAEAGKGVFSLK